MGEHLSKAGSLVAGLAVVSLLGACAGGVGGEKGSPARLADRSAAAGDYATAAAFYQQAYDANPKSVDALVGLGKSYAGMGQYARSEQALNEAKSRRPNDPDVLLELARTQIGAGRASAALANLETAQKKRPRDLSIITAKGIALDRLSRHAEAQATYRDGLKRDPTNFVLSSNLGLSLGLSGRTDEGIRILRELVQDGAATANTRGNLALVYGLAGQDRDASATLSRDLSTGQIQNNIAYYRELRGLLRQGKPIGGYSQSPSAPSAPRRSEPAAAADDVTPSLPAPATAIPELAAVTKVEALTSNHKAEPSASVPKTEPLAGPAPETEAAVKPLPAAVTQAVRGTEGPR